MLNMQRLDELLEFDEFVATPLQHRPPRISECEEDLSFQRGRCLDSEAAHKGLDRLIKENADKKAQ